MPHNQNQIERLNYLEFKALFTGRISRSDLMKRFNISEAAATRDLAIYREEAPGNLEFDTTSKHYRISEQFCPQRLKNFEPDRVLHALTSGIGNEFGTITESFAPCEFPGRMQAPSIEILAAVSRAIVKKAVLRIEYLSDSGNHGLREIVPFSFAATGLKWMVRGYCRRKAKFSHFVLNRFRSAEVARDASPKLEETREHDDEWNRFLKLELIPHPAASLENRAMTAQEFQMVDDVYILRVRSALAGFVLRLWTVDCSEDHCLRMFPLALRNRLVLHDVDNAILAPGYKRGAV